MAKALGFQPKSLIKNIPDPTQRWKASVKDWVRELYIDKFGEPAPEAGKAPARASAPASVGVSAPPSTPAPRSTPQQAVDLPNRDYPWPDKPLILNLALEVPFGDNFDQFGEGDWILPYQSKYAPPAPEDVEEENAFMLRRQYLFRWNAQSIAIAMSELREVQKVAAFGAVARPLGMEVPRFRQFRRHGIEVLHECADLDLAVWMRDLSALKELKSAMSRGLIRDTPYGGVAHHQVDVHLFDAASGGYRGRLCIFRECPKPGKRECLVPDCGAEPFLQQFAEYRFSPEKFAAEPKVVLFDRAAGFRVRPPRVDPVDDRDLPF